MAYRNWGVALQHQGEYEQAITKYKKAIDTNSRLAVAFESWGHSLYSQRKFDEAIEKYNKAIEIDPESPISREYLEKSKSAAAKTKKSAPVDRE